MNFSKTIILASLSFVISQGHAFSISSSIETINKYLSSSETSQSTKLPHSTGNFGGCQDQFPQGITPNVPKSRLEKAQALCFTGFAIMYSGITKTPIYAAEVLNRERILNAKDEVRTNNFFEDARIPSAQRATLNDYKGSGFDRGHNAPAADQSDATAMAQSFSLANMMPQAPENNRKTWANIESATRKYVMRAHSNVYVITGSLLIPGACSYANNCIIGNGVVIPSHIYKLVYDSFTKKAWAYWVENKNDAKISKPITYAELVNKTGIEFLPGVYVEN